MACWTGGCCTVTSIWNNFTIKLTNAFSDGSPRPSITGYGGHFLFACTIKPVPILAAVGDDVLVGIGWLEISLHKDSWLKARSCASCMIERIKSNFAVDYSLLVRLH